MSKWQVIVATAIVSLAFRAKCADEDGKHAPAAPPIYHRPCTTDDLKGAYLLVYLRETPEGNESQGYKNYPYQYIEFYPNNSYASVGLERPHDTPASLELELGALHKQINFHYTLEAEGILDMYINANLVSRSRCLEVFADEEAFKKNDLVLDGYSKNGKNEIYKIYRRWY